MELSPLCRNIRPEGELPPQEAAAFDLLEELGIPYDRISGDPADNMEKCALVSQALGVSICKNLFLCNRQKTQFYLLCMPSDKPFHTKDLSHQLGCARLSFAPPEAMEELLRVHPGSASVLSLLFDRDRRVQLVMDRETQEAAFFSCHPCESTGTLKLHTRDVLEVFLPRTGHQPVTVELPWE